MKEDWTMHINKESLHHAYCLEGEKQKLLGETLNFLQNFLGLKIQGNPDLWMEDFDTLGIDDSRRISDMQSNKAFGDSKKIYILSVNSITVEAQNAFLKLFEEPTPNTHFFLLIESADRLLPTLKSRLFILSTEKKAILENDAKSFLEGSTGERLAHVKKISDSISQKKKGKDSAFDFLDTLEVFLEGRLRKEKSKALLRSLSVLVKNRNYMHDRSSSVKIILDNVAINIK